MSDSGQTPESITVTYTNGTSNTWTQITSWTVTDTGYTFIGRNGAGNLVEVTIVTANTTNIEIQW